MLQCQEWVPDSATLIELFEKFTQQNASLKLDWTCPGRKRNTSEDSDDDKKFNDNKDTKCEL